MEKKKLNHHGDCLKCKKSWDAGEIWKAWRKMEYYKDKTDDELKAMQKESYSEPYRFSKLLGVEIRGLYDGVSFWQCPFCNTTWDRWTLEIVDNLKEEIKNRRGRKT